MLIILSLYSVNMFIERKNISLKFKNLNKELDTIETEQESIDVSKRYFYFVSYILSYIVMKNLYYIFLIVYYSLFGFVCFTIYLFLSLICNFFKLKEINSWIELIFNGIIPTVIMWNILLGY